MTYAARLAAGLLAVVLLAGCAEAATAQPTPTPQASPIPTSKPASLQLSDAMLTAPDSQPFFVFQAAGDARLRGVTWDGSVNGLFTRSGPLGLYGQSPDGRYVVLNGSIYNRHGQAIGPFPWPGKDLSAAWSPDSATMCRAYSPTQITGSALQLDDALPGHTPTTVARGFATFFDQSSYPVLACDPRAGRAVIAQFDPTGSAALRVWVIRLTDGTVVRSMSAGRLGRRVRRRRTPGSHPTIEFGSHAADDD